MVSYKLNLQFNILGFGANSEEFDLKKNAIFVIEIKSSTDSCYFTTFNRKPTNN